MAAGGGPMLELQAITKHFEPNTPVVEDVSLTVHSGEILCLLGPSGCGKTTLLRMIAGLERPDQGRVLLAGQDITQTPTYLRHFGLMFQDYALFPHLTVGENVAFGLQMAGVERRQVTRRVAEMLDLVDLPSYADRSIDGLSGGEQQRVALARTLAPSPRLLMLDEPLANLDRRLREELADELRQILKRIKLTTVFVTHDQEEAFALADRLAIMHQGRIEQVGSPPEVYARPSTTFVASFLGFQNLLPVHVDVARWPQVETSLGPIRLPADQPPVAGKSGWWLLIRPDAVHLVETMAAGWATDQPVLHGLIAQISFRGSLLRLRFVPDQDPTQELTFEVPSRGIAALQAGDRAVLLVDPTGLCLLQDTGSPLNDSMVS